MNNNRRQKLHRCSSSLKYVNLKLEYVVEKLSSLLNFKQEINELSQTISDTVQKLEQIYAEEQNAYDSLPENLQFSDIGMNIDFAMSDIQDAQNDTEKLLEQLDALEETYFQFLSTYNPQPLISKIESVTEVIEDAKESIEYATQK